MAEEPEAAPAEDDSEPKQEEPVAPVEPEDTAALSPHETGGTDGAENRRQTRTQRTLSFLGRLTVNEWLTFLVALGGLVVSALTYINAADTSDLKGAVRHLSALADQTRREADAQQGQLGIMREQVAALKDQVAEAKGQTKAISKQTDAIVGGTKASIRAYAAQERNADLATISQQARITIDTLSLSGLESSPDDFNKITALVTYQFENAGGGPLSLIRTHIGLASGVDLPAAKMPEPQVTVSGNDLVIAPGHTFNNSRPATFRIGLIDALAWKSGTKEPVVFGYNEYRDAAGHLHTRCFAFIIKMKDGKQDSFIAVGGDAYHCDT